ncbi:hypothetical protein [Ammoniphilus resinae]|uniref:Uncharacterized protein n=1 Tax=Ammoniphilus resinae TaxID=861532 RepID=A0ABS4GNN8_9BACL|nr:hypothetical protein [Ammoniphilus resinae]MBP1931883.1 hypothetical protein [Ammoniphilus resinae]
MFAQKTKKRRTKGRSISDRYLTRAERKIIDWYEKRRINEKVICTNKN